MGTCTAPAREGYCERYRVPHGAGPLRGRLPACSRPRAARARARQCDGACGRTQGRVRTPTGRSARSQAHGAASHAGQAHKKLNSLSSDSAAGIVPSSEFEKKDLRRAWFAPLCTEMRTHRSVPRTHTSTARVGRNGSSSERVLDTGARGGCCTRALFVPGRRKLLQPCRSAHTPSIVLARVTDTRKLTSDAHARTRAAKEEYEHARGTAEGYSRVGTRTAVRQCVHAHAGARADTNGPERSHAGARRRIVRGGRTGQ